MPTSDNVVYAKQTKPAIKVRNYRCETADGLTLSVNEHGTIHITDRTGSTVRIPLAQAGNIVEALAGLAAQAAEVLSG